MARSPVPSPPPLGATSPLFVTWKRGDPFERVFNHAYAPTAFNPGFGGGGRFHFFAPEGGPAVPILYASDQTDGALAETVFHDVPVEAQVRVVRASRLATLSIATLRATRDLRLVRLSGPGLTRLRLRPENLTDTPASEYPRTRAWAQALHQACPDADGLLWMSRQFNEARAVVLFGTRVHEDEMEVMTAPLPLYAGPGRMRVEDAANRAGILVL